MAKRILLVAGATFASLVFFIAIIFLESDSHRPTLPLWLTQVKPTHTSRVEDMNSSGFTIEESRRFKTTLSVMEHKLDTDLSKAEGWSKTSSQIHPPSWYAHAKADGLRLTIFKRSEGVVVHTAWDHKTTVAEKLKHMIRRIFGAKD